MFDDLALFVAIVESGSLSAAARRAGLPPATVTRRLQQLERSLAAEPKARPVPKPRLNLVHRRQVQETAV